MLPRIGRSLAQVTLVAALLLSRDAITRPSGEYVQDALRDLLASNNHLLSPIDHRFIEAFYNARGYQPLWYIDGRATDRARAAIKYLEAADAEGLRSADYRVSDLDSDRDAVALAAAELRLSEKMLTYARHAERGRILYTQVSGDIFYPVKAFDRSGALSRLADSQDIAATLASFSPPQAGYAALRQKLAELRASTSDSSPDGRRIIDKIIVNMERWRWMPRELGVDYVLINIPNFTLDVVHAGKVTWTTRTVVGAPTWRTPIMSAEMTSITLNPIWNVPDSLVKEELAEAGEDYADHFERIGMRSFRRDDGTLHLYQLPNGVNSLGQIRFNFPNKFAVYQHDTPLKNLFAEEWRAYSHGCMRVENPFVYAQKVLAIVWPEKDYNEKRLYGLLGGDENNIVFPRTIPIHLTYQTAYVDSADDLRLQDDIYGYDERMRVLLDHVPRVSKPRAKSFWEKFAAMRTRFLARTAHWWQRQERRFGIYTRPMSLQGCEADRCTVRPNVVILTARAGGQQYA